MSKPTLTDFIVEDVTALVHDANLGTGVAELVVSDVGESVEIQA